MSVAAAGGSDDGNGGGDKKGKWNVPESVPPSFEEEMEEAEERPTSAVENFHSLKQSLHNISKKEESLRKHTTYFQVTRARPTIKKRRIRLKEMFDTTSSSSKAREHRASSLPPPTLHDHDKDSS